MCTSLASKATAQPSLSTKDTFDSCLSRELDYLAAISRECNAVLLRDPEMPCAPGGMLEVDLLVARSEVNRMAKELARLDYREKPSYACEPHRFFIKLDLGTGVWFKVDVVTELWYGGKTKWLRSDHLCCLRWRLECKPWHRLNAEHELTALLLRVLLEKRKPSPARAARIAQLSTALHDQLLAEHGTTMFHRYIRPAFTTSELNAVLASQSWRGSTAKRLAVAWNLLWSEPGNARRFLRATAQRVLRPFVTALFQRGLLVVLLGPDGAGKSTLSEKLRNDPELGARTIYMGAYGEHGYQGHVQRPVVNRSGLTSNGAIRYLWRLVSVRYRLCSALLHKLRGRNVVFDRYVYDSLVNSKPQTFWQRVRLRLLNSGWPRPDIIILLDAPGKVLFERKHEHTPERLEQQRSSYRALRMKLPQMVVVDATQDLFNVRQQVVSAIWNVRCAQFKPRRSYDLHSNY